MTYIVNQVSDLIYRKQFNFNDSHVSHAGPVNPNLQAHRPVFLSH